MWMVSNKKSNYENSVWGERVDIERSKKGIIKRKIEEI